jgi:predicted metal-dependent phosphoesterase TrpH
MQKGYADLHLHTVASDGTQTLEELVRRAKANALSCVAVTDHDVISDRLTERVAERDGIEVITGVELKADFDGVSGELLGYFVDPAEPELARLLAWMEEARVVRMERMVAKCREQGFDVSMEDIRAYAQGNVGRPHLARVLVDKGAVSAMDEAFHQYIGRHGPCYVSLEKIGLVDAVRILHGAGGVVSVAHPCLMHVDDWDGFLDGLLQVGVDGIESVYPYRDPKSADLTIAPESLAAKANQRGFLVTGGSDDHGEDSSKTSIGSVHLPYSVVEAIKKVAGL